MSELERFWSVLLESPQLRADSSAGHVSRRRAPKALIGRTSLSARLVPSTLTAAVLIALAVLGVRSTTHYLASPIQGAIAAALPGVYRPSIDMAPATIEGDVASFSYPRGMSARTSQAPHFPTLASYNLTYRNLTAWNLAVSVVVVPTGNLYDNNAYRFRLVNPQAYTQSRTIYNGVPVTIMTDKTTGGYAKVGFLVHGQYQAVVSLSGEDQSNTADLQSTFAMVLGSWHWLKD